MFKVLFSLVVALVLAVYEQAEAVFDLTGVTIDTAPIFALALIVITAIAAIWCIRKLVKLGNKS